MRFCRDDIEVILLYRPEAFIKLWPAISKGLEKVFEYQNGDDNIQQAFNEITSGNLSVWIIMHGSKYCGFFTTYIRQIPSVPVKNILVIYHFYKVKDANSEVIDAVGEIIDDIAKALDCVEIRFYTLRKGFERWIKKYGYEMSYTEYVKRIKKGGKNGRVKNKTVE